MSDKVKVFEETERSNEKHLLYVKNVLIEFLQRTEPLNAKVFVAFINVCEGKKPGGIFKDAYHVKEVLEDLILDLQEEGRHGSLGDAKQCLAIINVVIHTGRTYTI